MTLRTAVAAAGLVLLAAGASRAQTPLGTAFTYQSRLTTAGVPATGGRWVLQH
jgi:hypothetical protein